MTITENEHTGDEDHARASDGSHSREAMKTENVSEELQANASALAAQARAASDACYEGALAALEQHYPRLADEAFYCAEIARLAAEDLHEWRPRWLRSLEKLVDDAQAAIVAAREITASTVEFQVAARYEARRTARKLPRDDDPPTPPPAAPAGASVSLRRAA
jgi:hypothetical protein